MSIDTWGDKPESQISARLILQAIADLIAAHEADPDAHLEVGESLQSHKASEIIDHLALSIVTDKLAEGSVTIDKYYEDKFYYRCMFESLDQWITTIPDATAHLYIGAGELTIVASNVLNNVVKLFNEIQSVSVGFDRNPWFQCMLLLTTDATGLDFQILLGGGTPFVAGSAGFGFYWHGSTGKFYARHDTGSVFVDTEIAGSWSEVNMELRAEMYDNGATIKYYINDVLVSTHSSATCGIDNNNVFNIAVKTKTAGYGGTPTYLRALIFSEDN